MQSACPRSVLAAVLAAVLGGAVFAAAPAAAGKAFAEDVVLDAASADRYLRPGDVFVKYEGDSGASLTQRGIRAAQTVIKALSKRFFKGIEEGDPRAFHLGIYLGRGLVAEAQGGSLATARVATRTLDAHAGYLIEVYRPADKTLAARAAAIAQRWANGRMKYAPPILVPFRRASFGPSAQKEALAFARAAGRSGGPASFQKMFCSQFIVAVYQAALLAPALARKPGLRARELRMPIGLDVHASAASPLAFHARLVAAARKTKGWSRALRALVRATSRKP